MNANLSQLRESVAGDRLKRFDFGAPVRRTEAWVETMRDALSCKVHLSDREGSRCLTFRVVFEPASSQVRDVEVGECLPLG